MGSTWLEPTTGLLSLPLHASAASGLGLALLALLDARLSEQETRRCYPLPSQGPSRVRLQLPFHPAECKRQDCTAIPLPG